MENILMVNVSLVDDNPNAARWNTNTTVGVKDLRFDSNFVYLVISLLVVSVWVIYITFYNSRLFGVIVTSIVNRFIDQNAYFKVGSFSFSVLSGKVMFRDLAYITADSTVRVQDGFFIFKWWQVYMPKEASDLSSREARLFVVVNGLELHLYNRSRLYSRLERLFGLDPVLLGPDGDGGDGDEPPDKGGGEDGEGDGPGPEDEAAVDPYRGWRDLVPVIKADISTGRVVFGNRLVPTTLIVSVEEAKCLYSTKPSASQYDLFMHYVKMTAENFKVIMAPSRSYTGRRDDPPRYMGEGFVVLQSNNVDIYAYMDVPGWVPAGGDDTGTERLANGDPCRSPPPVCGIEVKCGRGTDFSYGPWADRQRDSLFKFFFPASYEPQTVTPPPRPGQRRLHQALDVRVSTLFDATMDVLFTKNQETSAIHMNLGPGSYMEITVPWVVGENGYCNRVIGQLLHLDATTSLTYRNLLECESLEFNVSMQYPLYWNGNSDWTFSLTFCKTTAYFVYAHKYFLTDLLDDWSSSQPPDLLKFAPCNWSFQMLFKEVELITLTNAGNWVDCSSQSPENAHLAVCGDMVDLSFDLPFVDFLPETVPFLFRVEAECLDLLMWLPEVRASRAVLLSVAANALVSGRDGTTYTPGAPAVAVTAASSAAAGAGAAYTVPAATGAGAGAAAAGTGVGNGGTTVTVDAAATPGSVAGSEAAEQPAARPGATWRNLCKASCGWVDCWRVPVLSLRIGYTYHPMPPFGPSPQADIPTPDKEAILLSPLRAPKRKMSPLDTGVPVTRDDFIPDSLAPDHISVDLELGPSELFIYGCLVDNIINFKDNIFGVYEQFTDMACWRDGPPNDTSSSPPAPSPPPPPPAGSPPDRLQAFDPRKFRPFKVTVAVTMHDIRGHLMKHCAPGDPPCPTLTLERIGFEMSKSYWETRLQLLLSPIVAVVRDTVPRPEPHRHLAEGHLVLSGLQVRGHAMFSNRGRNVEEDTVEYAWLLEVQAGTVTGRLTAAQLYQTVTGLESFLQLLNDHESELPPPPATRLCHHDHDQDMCEYTTPEDRCPTGDDIKYKMFRLGVDGLDLHLVECGTSLNVQVSSCRVSTCNLYGEHIKQGLTVLLPGVDVYNFICANMPLGGAPDAPPLWVEAGAARVGPVIVDLALSCGDKWGHLQAAQDKFLRLHDESQRRLWFLWETTPGPSTGPSSGTTQCDGDRCGCVGGCAFFGRNVNGRRFFHPSKTDETDGMNRAEYRISESDDDLGYGQSLLHPGRLMFDLPAGSPPAADVSVWGGSLTTGGRLQAPGAASPRAEFGAVSPPAGVDEVDASTRHQSDSRLALPTGRAGQSTLSLQTLPSVASAPAAAGRRGSRHSIASVGTVSAGGGGGGGGGTLRAMASLGSEQSEYSELYFSADEDGLSSPMPTFQTPPSTLHHSGGGASDATDRAPARADGRPETSRQVSFDALRPPSSTSSSSGSNISSGSFLSAASVASGEDTLLPDINTVDLVAQVDRPITDSPLLMASYIYHLDQVECLSWERATPRASASGGIALRPLVRKPDGGLTLAGRLFSPAFRRRTRGFSHIRLAAAPAEAEEEGSDGDSPTPEEKGKEEQEREGEEAERKLWDVWENERGEVGGVVGSHGRRGASHTTLVVRLREDTRLALTPIMLEAATRFAQTLVPALSRMHPQTVVSRHRRSAVASVLASNQLKRDPHVRLSVRRASSLRREPLILQQTQHRQVQAFVFVPQVSITFLQASITEETISFSALDDVRDLTCVSLAAVRIEGLQLQLLQQRRTQRSLHVLARNQSTSTKKQHGKKKAKDVQVTYEPSLVETVDADSQETMIAVDVGRSHLQLRRLRNDSQLLKDAVITSIPPNSGKVCFTYADVPSPPDGDFGQPSMEPGREVTSGFGEEKLGFNMMEVGVEHLELKTVLKKGGGASATTATGPIPGGVSGTGATTGRTGDDEPPSAASRTDESTGSESKDQRTTALNVDVRAVWVNCAAPPKTAVMRKTDYTRSDWNMLSTASPSINAWLNPANRLAGGLGQVTSAHTRRQLAAMACLMTAALDHPNIHATPKSKYSCVTCVAQTLQEDPSCQLCSVLARYIQQTPLSELETELRARFLPDTTTLKQGVLVLSRQWKNVLWMPFLLGHKFKDPSAVPTFLHQPASRAPSVDGEVRPDEEIDERTCLLDIPLPSCKAPRSPTSASGGAMSPISPPTEPRPSLPHQPLRSARHSVMFPLLSGHHGLESPVHALGRLNGGFGRQTGGESSQSLCGAAGGVAGAGGGVGGGGGGGVGGGGTGGGGGTAGGGGAGTIGSASRDSLDPLQSSRHGSLRQKTTDDSCEDLYSWMARQQATNGAADHRCRLPLSQIRDLAGAVVADSEHQPLLSVSSDEDAEVSSQPPPPSGLQVLEAHQIFEPLLASAGVLSEVLGGETILRQLGNSVNLVSGLQSLRIDISESNGGAGRQRRGRAPAAPLSTEPAFTLRGGRVELDLRHVADTAVGEWIQRQPNAFVTRRQLKRHTQAVVNFTVCADSLALKVNMPLLRLVNQMASVYWNARETQHGLRTERLRKSSRRGRHRKNDSSSGSEVPDLKSPELHDDPLAVPLSAGGHSGSDGSLFRFPPAPLPLHGARSSTEQGSGRDSQGQGAGWLEPGHSSSSPDRPEERPETPRCWRTVYHLLKLYAIVPETKTVRNSCRLATIHEHSPDPYRGTGKYEVLRESAADDAEAGRCSDSADAGRPPSAHTPPLSTATPHPPPPPPPNTARKAPDQRLSSRELTPLLVFGVAKVRRTLLEATLSGLRLESEVRELQASLSGRHYSRAGRRGHQTSLTGHLGGVQVALQEQLARTSQTVVSMTVAKSQCLYSTEAQKRGGLRERNSALVTIGNITIDIPQHPVALHSMVTRSSAHLSNTLKELRHSRSGRLVRASTFTIEDLDTPPSQLGRHRGGERTAREFGGPAPPPTAAQRLLQPLAVHFSVVLQSLSITAALLPSLQAQYKMDTVTSMGVTGSKAKFTVDLAKHDLSFRTRVEDQHLPSSASVALPRVHISADYMQEEPEPGPVPEGVELCPGSYFSTEAEIGALEHTLSTDLLNHLVFVQKVFMMEVNDVVQKMAGSDKFKSPLLSDETAAAPEQERAPPPPPPPAQRPVLYSLRLTFRGIQITATTPTNYAVRLETGLTELQLSNRYQRLGTDQSRATPLSRLYGRAQLRLNVSLGQLIRNVVFEEADPEFHQYAYFKTQIGLSNSFHADAAAAAARSDKEVVLIALRRPLVYVQPMAVDKAILVWLNYRNAYDYWSEQRRTLNREVLTATQQVLDKVPHISHMNVNQLKSTLFLQVTVDDLGICLPINSNSLLGGGQMVTDADSRDALVLTLEETAVSAMTCDSLICSGRFTGFCLRFATDFETSLDDWKPDTADPAIMNLCVVSEGTYEVCSHTVGMNRAAAEDAKWILNVSWQMEGVDINVDINIGRHLSALANTLTTFTDVDGEEEEEAAAAVIGFSELDGPSSSDKHPALTRRRTVSSTEHLYSEHLLGDASDPRKRAKLLEMRMNEQAKVVHDLMLHGASRKVLEEETRKLEAFESVVFKDFRRDMMKRLRRQSIRASTVGMGTKLSLGNSAPPPAAGAGRGRSAAGRRAARSMQLPGERRPGTVDLASSEESMVPELDEDTGSPSARVTFSDTQILLSRHASIDESDEPPQSGPWSRRPARTGADTVDGPVPGPSSPRGASSRGASPNGGGVEVEVNNVPVNASDLDGVELRRPPLSPASPSGAPKQAPPVEPNIHFELDVKVFVSSGQCALHTRDPAHLQRTDTDDQPARDRRGERNRGRQHSGMSDESTPSSSRRRTALLHSSSQTRLKKAGATLSASIVDLTIFHIPGLDVKLHYDSKMVTDHASARGPAFAPSTPESPRSTLSPGLVPSASSTPGPSFSPAGSSRGHSFDRSGSTGSTPSIDRRSSGGVGANTSGGVGGVGRRPPLSKRASLFVWMTLQSIPTETVVSPHILDFLDQLFELLPMTRGLNLPPPSPEADTSEDPLSGAPGSAAGSFPVDVIVFFHMQPSTFRFSCLPVSKVECLLRLPSLDLVFSSKRSDLELMEQQPPQPPSSAGRRRTGSRTARDPGAGPSESPAGGLSATGLLADFSLYVFHPYGNKYSGKDHVTSPLNDTDRKDSLSVKVEFVQFTLSRSRKLELESGGTEPSKAIVRFSTVIDLGSASFKYDMRRLTEILAFPKAWYRRTIVRRMFLGDLGDTTISAESDRATTPEKPPAAGGSGTGGAAGSSSTPGATASTSAAAPAPASASRSSSGTEVRPRPSKLHVLQRRLSLDPGPPTPQSGGAVQSSSWETLVLFAVNFTKLNVHMNMGNVMGNVTWQTNGFTSEGRLSIGSTGHKNMFISLGLGGSSLEAKGGIVGGNVEVGKIDTYLHILEDPGVEPSHTVGLKLQTVELRLDYMGTSVLMGRVSALHATLRDEWRVTPQLEAALQDATKRPAMIFIHCEVSWDQLQLMISKSTTTDLIKMYSKLEEFFVQQFQSSRRLLIGLNERPSSGKSSSLRGRTGKQRRLTEVLQERAQQQSDTRHHRHWHEALRLVAALKLKTFAARLPPSGTVLGGTIDMRGNTISLACFHGLNFKSKSWALFSLREPSINFSTESQELETGTPPDVHVVETLSISLGLLSHQSTARHVSMATVTRVTRTILFPPQFRTMQEWFHYTFSTSELDEVERFPSLERAHWDGTGGSGERRQSRGQASPPPPPPMRLHDHNHTAEIVFALPPMQMHLKTEHTQTGAEPDMTAPKPVVVCSFVTEFEDHIFVTTDAENFFFLHDLIDTYISRQPESGSGSSAGSTGRPRTADKTTTPHRRTEGPVSAASTPATAATSPRSPTSTDSEHKVNDPTQMLQQDWREFECRTWHLEPTVRLLSWAGRRIEPYGVDFILNKLGFRHARSTIPKWLQRGSMDPLDKVLAVLVEKTVQVTREGH